MCYSPSNEEMAEIAFSSEVLDGDLDWVNHLRRSQPTAYGIYLELKRTYEFQKDAHAALAQGWPTDEDLADLGDLERLAILVGVMS